MRRNIHYLSEGTGRRLPSEQTEVENFQFAGIQIEKTEFWLSYASGSICAKEFITTSWLNVFRFSTQTPRFKMAYSYYARHVRTSASRSLSHKNKFRLETHSRDQQSYSEDRYEYEARYKTINAGQRLITTTRFPAFVICKYFWPALTDKIHGAVRRTKWKLRCIAILIIRNWTDHKVGYGSRSFGIRE